MKDRIYICHTYYHAYVTFLKELKIRAEADPVRKAGTATLVLSKMSNNFENLKARVESTGLFEEVLEFDERAFSRSWQNIAWTPGISWGI